ncbi:unnamed protein product [Linum tenue]|uniref:Uncharacterized protein n=1 Tax=Linum tenue TaxID=586396 RepID=A0AAV0GVP6_9ROSI|nr:unnamed protein product [Linum tenue]
MTGVNLVLTAFVAVLCVFLAPTAAGPGIPEIKAYLNGIDTPNMFDATILLVKVGFFSNLALQTIWLLD